MSHSDDILKGVRTRLLVSYPFFGSAISDLRLAPDMNVKRFHANGPAILYNGYFVENSPSSVLAYWLCREILQLTMDYGGRKKRRSRVLWAVAVEYCVNSILAHEGLTKGVQVRFYRREFDGRSAEEIYAALVRESVKLETLKEIELLDSQLTGRDDNTDLGDREQDLSGIARVMKLDADSLMEIIEESQLRMREYGDYKAKTLEIISKARLSERTLGKRGFSVDLPIMAESMERIRWEDILSTYAFNDMEAHSYRRFRRKYMSSDIYLPQRFHLFNSIIVCIDVSASVGEETLSSFFSDVLYLAGSKPGHISVRLIQIDALIQSDDMIEPGTESEAVLRRRGFGGTDFTMLFRMLHEENNTKPVLIFTDGRAIVPEREPEGYEVIWVTTDLSIPWGTNIQFGGGIEA